jgi:hypothetical protein
MYRKGRTTWEEREGLHRNRRTRKVIHTGVMCMWIWRIGFAIYPYVLVFTLVRSRMYIA